MSEPVDLKAALADAERVTLVGRIEVPLLGALEMRVRQLVAEAESLRAGLAVAISSLSAHALVKRHLDAERAKVAKLRAAMEEAASGAGIDWLNHQLKLAAALEETKS